MGVGHDVQIVLIKASNDEIGHHRTYFSIIMLRMATSVIGQKLFLSE